MTSSANWAQPLRGDGIRANARIDPATTRSRAQIETTRLGRPDFTKLDFIHFAASTQGFVTSTRSCRFKAAVEERRITRPGTSRRRARSCVNPATATRATTIDRMNVVGTVTSNAALGESVADHCHATPATEGWWRRGRARAVRIALTPHVSSMGVTRRYAVSAIVPLPHYANRAIPINELNASHSAVRRSKPYQSDDCRALQHDHGHCNEPNTPQSREALHGVEPRRSLTSAHVSHGGERFQDAPGPSSIGRYASSSTEPRSNYRSDRQRPPVGGLPRQRELKSTASSNRAAARQPLSP